MSDKFERLRNFLITPEFILSAYELPKEHGRKIFKALKLFLSNPSHPSLHYEQLGGRQSKMQSIRIDDAYRIILSDGHPPRLIYVGNHDQAYRVAERLGSSVACTLHYMAKQDYEIIKEEQLESKVSESVGAMKTTLPSAPVVSLSTEDLEQLVIRTRKYLPLSHFFASLGVRETSLQVKFAHIEEILNQSLPKSAKTYKAWWANDATHVQATSWLAMGWKTRSIDLQGEIVIFIRDSQ
jgi:mRNA-degrading endonuclease RelE of RelBE toxin-antitoxin system